MSNVKLIWALHPKLSWCPGRATMSKKGQIIVKFEDGTKIKLEGSLSDHDEAHLSLITPIHDDIAELEGMSDAVLLNLLKNRYISDNFYTYSGLSLIFVNPRKAIPELTRDDIRKTQRVPHIDSITESCFQNLMHEHKNHFLVVTGVSGSGRTRTNRRVHDFLAEKKYFSMQGTYVSGKESIISPGSSGVPLKTRLLNAYCVIDAFSCVYRRTNDNTTSATMLQTTTMDLDLGIPLGVELDCLFLMRGKLHTRPSDESCFHIFYQLLIGADAGLKETIGIGSRGAEDFRMLKEGNWGRDLRKDAIDFHKILVALESLSIEHDVVVVIFKCLLAVLLLGNVRFVGIEDTDSTKTTTAIDGKSSSSSSSKGGSSKKAASKSKSYKSYKISPKTPLREIAILLGIPEAVLDTALRMTKPSRGPGEVPIPLRNAQRRCHTLASAIYEMIFMFVLKRVNVGLASHDDEAITVGSVSTLDLCAPAASLADTHIRGVENLIASVSHERTQLFSLNMFLDAEMDDQTMGGNYDDDDDKDYHNDEPVDDITAAASGVKSAFTQAQETLVSILDDDEDGVVPAIMKQAELEVDIHQDASAEKFRSGLVMRLSTCALTDDPRVHIASNIDISPLIVNHGIGGEIAYDLTGYIEECKHATAIQPVIAALCVSSTNAIFQEALESSHEDPEYNRYDMGFQQFPQRLKLTLARFAESEVEKRMVRCICPHQLMESPKSKVDPVFLQSQMHNSGIMNDLQVQGNLQSLRMTITAFASRFKGTIRAAFRRRNVSPTYEGNSPLLRSVIERALVNTLGEPERDTTWRVGSTFVLVRYQHHVDDLRIEEQRERMANATVIQAGFRGFRAKCMSLERNPCVAILARRWRELARMTAADKEAADYEQLWRDNPEIAEREEHERSLHFRRQLKTKQRIDFLAASRIQGLMRGVRTRKTFPSFKATRLLTKALLEPSEALLESAIMSVRHVLSPSKKLRQKEAKARECLISFQGEAFVQHRVESAVRSENVMMLQDACRLVEECGGATACSTIYHDAVDKMHVLQSRRATLATLRRELDASASIPELLRRADAIVKALQLAEQYGLNEDNMVREAKARLARVDGLLRQRDEMRRAVECCDFAVMHEQLRARKKGARVYGNNFLAIESCAVKRMLEMHAREQSMAADDEMRFVSENDSCHSERDLFGSAWGSRTAHLPMFLRSLLEKVHGAVDAGEYKWQQTRLQKAVPDPRRREHYNHLFKWVVAFATWRYEGGDLSNTLIARK